MRDRRAFVTTIAGGIAALILPRSAYAHRSRVRRATHPEPRPGYTAENVATAAQLDGDADLIAIFDGIREIPQIADGIRCNCGCADWPGNYSLLSCFEGPEAMAMWCPNCQGEGRLVARMAKQGRTLDQIRAAIDARGGGA